MRKLLIFGALFVGVIIVVLVVLSSIPESREIPEKILEVRWSKIVVSSIEEFDYKEDDLLKRGINPEQAREILNNPNQYRRVIFSFRFNNNSTWAAVADIELEKHMPEQTKRRLVWISENLRMPFCGSGRKGLA